MTALDAAKELIIGESLVTASEYKRTLAALVAEHEALKLKYDDIYKSPTGYGAICERNWKG